MLFRTVEDMLERAKNAKDKMDERESFRPFRKKPTTYLVIRNEFSFLKAQILMLVSFLIICTIGLLKYTSMVKYEFALENSYLPILNDQYAEGDSPVILGEGGPR